MLTSPWKKKHAWDQFPALSPAGKGQPQHKGQKDLLPAHSQLTVGAALHTMDFKKHLAESTYGARPVLVNKSFMMYLTGKGLG